MKIKLPGFIIADIYKDSLVALEPINSNKKDNRTSEAKTYNKEKFYSGENLRHVVIFIKNTEQQDLSHAHMNLLKSILSACKLQFADVALINFINNPYTYQQLKDLLKPKYVLLFGINPTEIDLPFAVPFYQVQKHDNCTFLSSPSLQTFANNDEAAKTEKRKLWVSLKKMFGV